MDTASYIFDSDSLLKPNIWWPGDIGAVIRFDFVANFRMRVIAEYEKELALGAINNSNTDTTKIHGY